MERPNLPALLEKARERGCDLDLSDVTYYVGRGTVLPRHDGKGQPKWLVAYFAFMQRNSVHLGDHLRLPPESVVEIGRQVSI
jgi:KUP system potassium uptake protein